MRSIEADIKRLERRAKERGNTGEYCREHFPEPLIIFSDGEQQGNEQPDYCPICRKPYAPGVIRPIISFHPAPDEQPDTE